MLTSINNRQTISKISFTGFFYTGRMLYLLFKQVIDRLCFRFIGFGFNTVLGNAQQSDIYTTNECVSILWRLIRTVLAWRCCLLITRYVWVRIADTISRFCSWNFIHRTISAENGSWNSNRCISLQSCIEFRWSRMSGAKVKRRLKLSLFIWINPFVNHQLFIVRHFKWIHWYVFDI